ncbi:hypothetical protein [Paraglaciecola arctica]|uniref:Uncharacterized protein n=1 Tax=Paraglaciecola arctica BSs20135 TaxID=493475 RepID=K6YTA4_9ALTE|nr:hypothetical protein [Paraglaciecola arctica]GAC21382.1 hypothetical protein GARC_4440 [Paraglaciecola arctica BSs20135]
MENALIYLSYMWKIIFSSKLVPKLCQPAIFLMFPMTFISTVTYADTCDKYLLERADTGESGYRKRGRICEGLYESPVSADFELVSLVEHPLNSYVKGDTISIELPNVTQQLGSSSISIRGLALKPRLYYRMDTSFGPDSVIKWPVEQVLSSIKLDAHELGIYGWQESKTGKTYIPVSVSVDGQMKIVDPNFDAQAIVRAGVPIQKIAWRLLGEGISDAYNNVKKSYSVGTPIPIQITWPQPRPDFIKLEVAAKPMTSNDWIIQVFYIALPTKSKSE